MVFKYEDEYTTVDPLNLALRAKSKTTRGFWWTVTILDLAALICLMVILISDYQNNQTNAVIKLKKNKYPFPAVTFCNMNPYKQSALESTPELKSLIDEFNKASQASTTGSTSKSPKVDGSVGKRRKRQSCDCSSFVIQNISTIYTLLKGTMGISWDCSYQCCDSKRPSTFSSMTHRSRVARLDVEAVYVALVKANIITANLAWCGLKAIAGCNTYQWYDTPDTPTGSPVVNVSTSLCNNCRQLSTAAAWDDGGFAQVKTFDDMNVTRIGFDSQAPTDLGDSIICEYFTGSSPSPPSTTIVPTTVSSGKSTSSIGTMSSTKITSSTKPQTSSSNLGSTATIKTTVGSTASSLIALAASTVTPTFNPTAGSTPIASFSSFSKTPTSEIITWPTQALFNSSLAGPSSTNSFLTSTQSSTTKLLPSAYTTQTLKATTAPTGTMAQPSSATYFAPTPITSPQEASILITAVPTNMQPSTYASADASGNAATQPKYPSTVLSLPTEVSSVENTSLATSAFLLTLIQTVTPIATAATVSDTLRLSSPAKTTPERSSAKPASVAMNTVSVVEASTILFVQTETFSSPIDSNTLPASVQPQPLASKTAANSFNNSIPASSAISSSTTDTYTGHTSLVPEILLGPLPTTQSFIPSTDVPSKPHSKATNTIATVKQSTLQPSIAILVQTLLDKVKSDANSLSTTSADILAYLMASLPSGTLEKAGYTVSEVITRCVFNKVRCNLGDFKLKLDPDYGNCYTFNANANFSVGEQAGITTGLSVTYDVGEKQYLNYSQMAGVRVVVHEQGEPVFPDVMGFDVPSGFQSSAGMTRTQTKSIPFLSKPCAYRPAEVSTYNYNETIYATEACIRSCYQKQVIQRCQCGDPRVPLPKDTRVKFCELAKRECVIDNYEVGFGDCLCPPACEMVNYEITQTNMRWPIFAVNNIDWSGLDGTTEPSKKKQYARIDVYYETSDVLEYVEIELVTWEALMWQLSSLIGLALGISVISLFEMIQLGEWCRKKCG